MLFNPLSYLGLEVQRIIQLSLTGYLLDTINLLGPGDTAGTRQTLPISSQKKELNLQFSIKKKIATGYIITAMLGRYHFKFESYVSIYR